MASRFDIVDFIEHSRVVVLSGGFGTRLQDKGCDLSRSFWSASANLERPELLEIVHREFYDAGADVISTNTYRTQREAFRTAEIGYREKGADPNDRIAQQILKDYKLAADMAAINAVRAARNVQLTIHARGHSRPVYVAGSYGPIGDDHSAPQTRPNGHALLESHRRQAQLLAREGVDFLLPETAPTYDEATAMAQAAAETGKPFILSLSLHRETGRLFDGATVREVVRDTDYPQRIAVTINCTPADKIASALREILTYSHGYAGAYANGGGSPSSCGTWNKDCSPEARQEFVATMRDLRNIDAKRTKLMGGCCGADPIYIEDLANDARPERRHATNTAEPQRVAPIAVFG